MTKTILLAVGFVVVLQVINASAAPIASTTELYEMSVYIDCHNTCSNGKKSLVDNCIKSCDDKYLISNWENNWEKDGETGLDVRDLDLAYKEYFDEGTGDLVCYEEKNGLQIVVPKAFCGDPCATDPELCVDNDGDGLQKYQEELLGTSDNYKNEPCVSNIDCRGFSEECIFIGNNKTVCNERAVKTTFHLEEVVDDNSELILHLYYDYSPVPATLLDLNLVYSKGVVEFIDARRLLGLKKTSKELIVKQENPSDSTLANLRLIVVGKGNSLPIPYDSPIIELRFIRKSRSAGYVGFTKNAEKLRESIAPSQLEDESELFTNSDLWGKNQDTYWKENGDDLILHYDFEDLLNPLKTSSKIMNADNLCGYVKECDNAFADGSMTSNERAKQKSRVAELQKGVYALDQLVPGVSGRGGYLNGTHNHLELPLWIKKRESGDFFNDEQSFSLSTWFLFEGTPNYVDEDEEQRQVVFVKSWANGASSEESLFGLYIQANGPKQYSLVWFEGSLHTTNIEDPELFSTRTIASDLRTREWNHLGLSFDRKKNEIRIFINGQDRTVDSPISIGTRIDEIYPELNGADKKIDLSLEYIPQENIFYSTLKNGKYIIEKLNMHGMTRHAVLEDDTISFRDPHYSNETNELVFSSNESGNFEIWMSNADGTNRRQITEGFGNTSGGVFARRPRWSLDGKLIVFESNAYSRESKYTKFYFVPYDPSSRDVKVQVGDDKDPMNRLDRSELIEIDLLKAYALSVNFRHVTNPRWLEDSLDGEYRLAFSTYNRNYESWDVRIYTVEMPTHSKTLNTAETKKIIHSTGGDYKLVDGATISEVVGTKIEKFDSLVYMDEQTELVDYDQFTLEYDNETGRLSVKYTPNGFSEDCWDVNRNHDFDPNEDRDGDGIGREIEDCYLSKVEHLNIEYDREAFQFDVDVNDTASVSNQKGTFLINDDKGKKKIFTLFDVEPVHGLPKVKIQIDAPIEVAPIPYGAEIASIQFENVHGIQVDSSNIRDYFNIKLSEISQKIVMGRKLDGSDPQFQPDEYKFHRLVTGAMSPDGKILAGSVIQKARPTLVTLNLADLRQNKIHVSSRLSVDPIPVDSITWVKKERYHPPTWIGGYLNGIKKTYKYEYPGGDIALSALNGRLDEFKIYNYVRNDRSFLSESERGREWLVKNNQNGVLQSIVSTCYSHSDCPEYHLCDYVNKTCFVDICDPYADPADELADDCTDGVCTLVPMAINQGASKFTWACVAECGSDAQCYEEQCMNGPCSFCDSVQKACFECKTEMYKDEDFGISFDTVEGCPDSKSFECVDNACVTECYSFANGQSQYLCNDDEYCNKGHCEPMVWEWSDFAPSSLSGLGEMVIGENKYSVVKSDIYSVTVQAFGVEDYLHHPIVIVEGKFDEAGSTYRSAFKTNWFEIGRFTVYNVDESKAKNNPYTVQANHLFNRIRLRMIQPQILNNNRASTGLMGRDNLESEENRYRRTPGSLANIGYQVGIPKSEACRVKKARAKQLDASVEGTSLGGICGGITQDTMKPYLKGGYQSVVILDVLVGRGGGKNSVYTNNTRSKNNICSYQGENPAEALKGEHEFVDDFYFTNTRYFGDPFGEISNLKNAEYPSVMPGPETVEHKYKNKGFAVLNCNFAKPDKENTFAGLQLEFVTQTAFPEDKPAGIIENDNGCKYEVKVKSSDGTVNTMYKPCYEWADGDVNLDILNQENTSYNTLDLGPFRYFGEGVNWDNVTIVYPPVDSDNE